ncbi:MAG TPA: LptA/OstA family protein [Dongiaceae bacterium]|nr:LptA/OstA family protein [Dongiaceae bacterium]
MALICTVLFGAAAFAQGQGAATSGGGSADGGFDLGGGSQPIEISADNGIEWNRDAKTYTARGNAVAAQGNSEIHADTLVASYDTSSSQIEHVEAEGSVKIMNPNETAFGDHADYDRAKKLLVLTGSGLRIEGTAETVTARDAFEYWQDQDAMVAKGDVLIAKSNGTTIKSDTATSYFRKNAQTGKREAFQVKAEGHVRIDTGKEVVTCDRAVYDPTTQIAVLTGNVVLTQGRSTFQGARAELDMNKGISRLMPAPGQRVHTIIQPKNQQNAKPGAAPQGSGMQSGAPGQIALGGGTSNLAAGSQ